MQRSWSIAQRMPENEQVQEEWRASQGKEPPQHSLPSLPHKRGRMASISGQNAYSNIHDFLTAQQMFPHLLHMFPQVIHK